MTPLFGIELQKTDNLLSVFEVIHNYIYANDGLSPQQTLEEIMRVLFVKIADEGLKSKQFFITSEEIELTNKGIQVESFLHRISELFEQTKQNFADVFDLNEKVKLSPNALAYTVNKLQHISLTDSCNDSKGLAFQKFLANHEKGESGQFFTPSAVVDFCVNMIKPQPDETIIDPACGSGGFLLSSLRFMRRSFPDANANKIISQNLFGFDINKSIAKIARMQLLLEANGQVNVFCANSLANNFDLNHFSEKITDKEGFDIVFANPPFGTLGKITNSNILKQYSLGFKWTTDGAGFYKTNKLLTGQVTEILFIEKCLSLLRENGRMAIILPNGHFENSSLEYLRYFIKQNAKILAVVNLPQETFIPYGTGVKTSILFLEKQTLKNSESYKVFFSRINKLGYQGNKNATTLYKKDQFGISIKDEKGEYLLDEDFSSVISDYEKFKSNILNDASSSFILPSENLNGRFGYDFYLPKNRELISALKYKNAVKLCEIAEILKTRSKKLSKSDESVEYIELSDVNALTSEIINSTNYFVHDLPSRATYEVKKGDIITSVAGNSVGTKKHATALVTEEYNGCICTNGFRVLREFKIDSFYLLFYLRSDLFLRQVFMYRTGATIPSISDNDFANILVYIPNEIKVEEISQQMRTALKLRDVSRKSMENIKVELS
ncbi:MAG TPA: N-6 DNA methylase [Pyrinomonadaceae bacterium]|jgi:type I restriction enzyme M protein